MSDTPRTDKERGYVDGSGCWKYSENGDEVPVWLAEELESENADLKRQVEKANERTDDLIAAQIDVQAKLAEAQKDAERYRWLRTQNEYRGGVLFVTDASCDQYTLEDLDAAIDAAIASTASQPSPDGEQQ